MNFEKVRIRSFQLFPNDYLDIRTLAKYGLYYTGKEETCKCYFCGLEINSWNILMNPLLEHWRNAANCPILINNYTNNVPCKLK